MTTNNPAEAEQIVGTLRQLMVDHALPLWASKGWDDRNGGFIERLNLDGSPDAAAHKRVRVQARQIYCYAKAAQFGWYPGAKELALKALDLLITRASSPDGQPGYVHLLDAGGSVIDAKRDAYDHCIVLLGAGQCFPDHQGCTGSRGDR